MLNVILPLSTSAIILIAIGVLLIASELSSPSHGIVALLGLSGVIGGAAILYHPEAAAMVSAPAVLIAGLTALVAAGLLMVMGLSARRRRIRTGTEALLGMTGPILSWSGDCGHVLVHGERWRAKGGQLTPGGHARVTGIDGLTLHVEGARNDGATR